MNRMGIAAWVTRNQIGKKSGSVYLTANLSSRSFYIIFKVKGS